MEKYKNLQNSILKYAKNHNLKCKWIESSLLVDSIFDEWVIEPHSYYNYYIIQHKNKKNRYRKKARGNFHRQNGKFFSYYCALRYINEHDNHKLGY